MTFGTRLLDMIFDDSAIRQADPRKSCLSKLSGETTSLRGGAIGEVQPDGPVLRCCRWARILCNVGGLTAGEWVLAENDLRGFFAKAPNQRIRRFQCASWTGMEDWSTVDEEMHPPDVVLTEWKAMDDQSLLANTYVSSADLFWIGSRVAFSSPRQSKLRSGYIVDFVDPNIASVRLSVDGEPVNYGSKGLMWTLMALCGSCDTVDVAVSSLRRHIFCEMHEQNEQFVLKGRTHVGKVGEAWTFIEEDGLKLDREESSSICCPSVQQDSHKGASTDLANMQSRNENFVRRCSVDLE